MDPHFDGVIFQTHEAELARRLRHAHPPFVVLDVRPRSEWAAARIPGSLHVSAAALASGLPPGSSRDAEFFIVGRQPDDPAVREVSLALQGLGARRRVELTGGMHEWRHLGLPIESGEERAA